ncbi:hypothetical protein B0H19DRAFT_1087905 [Mycena capillaripes]|nr:hypothetical protein B0H19DRAFT_1087905 [Mycena capillaripes]
MRPSYTILGICLVAWFIKHLMLFYHCCGTLSSFFVWYILTVSCIADWAKGIKTDIPVLPSNIARSVKSASGAWAILRSTRRTTTSWRALTSWDSKCLFSLQDPGAYRASQLLFRHSAPRAYSLQIGTLQSPFGLGAVTWDYDYDEDESSEGESGDWSEE